MSESDVLARLDLRIEVLSPLHVGAGVSLKSKSFVLAGRDVYVSDESALLESVARSKRALMDFESFCVGDQPLSSFLERHNVKVEDIAQYRVRLNGTTLGRDLLLFIKTPSCPPQPYLPGSSLKGALRSALLRGTLLQNREARALAEKRVKEKFSDGKAKRADDALDQWYFGTSRDRDWQHYDWMRLFHFTDSMPVPLKNIQVAEVRTASLARDNKLEAKTYVLSPEVMTPRSVTHATLVLNTHLVGSVADDALHFARHWSRALRFVEACNRVAKEHIDQEIEFFGQCKDSDPVKCSEIVKWYRDLKSRLEGLREGECLLRIGWGTGYDSKTVGDVFEQQTFNDIRITYDLPVGRPGRRGALLPKAVSPKSRKCVIWTENGKPQIVPLGWVQITAR